MSKHNLFVEQWNAAGALLQGKQHAPVPDKTWEKLTKDLTKLIATLTPYYTEPKFPGPADIKAVKAHPLSLQIKAFVNTSREKKAFYSLAYFKEKCESLPDRSLSEALQRGTTRDSHLTAFLVYHYWKTRPEYQTGLERATKEIETDYQNSSHVKQIEQARALFRELQRESDLNRIVSVLQANFRDKVAVAAFTKAVGLKIPAGRKPIHERVAAKILISGELVRAKY